MRWRALVAVLIGLAAGASGAVADDETIAILFHQRPPYSYRDAAGRMEGLLVAPVAMALKRSGLAAEWVEMPPARQTEEIKRARSPLCGLGWFKRPEREAFARFSDPIYRDRPTVIVARRDDPRFADGVSLQESFRDGSRTLIVKAGYSYGAEIDGWIKALRPRSEISSGSNELLLGMIAQHRADYILMAPEEAEDLLDLAPALGAPLHLVQVSDAPAGERRYLMCSMATPAALVERLDAALPE